MRGLWVRVAAAGVVATFCYAAASAGGGVVGRRPNEARRARPDLVVAADRLRASMSVRYVTARDGDCTIFENCLSGAGKHRILEFDTYVVNASDVDLVLGNPADRPDLYEYSPCHRHYHLKNSFEYSVTHGGDDTIGVFDVTTGIAHLRNANTTGSSDVDVALADPSSSVIALAGDWDGSGDSTVGAFDLQRGEFRLLNSYRPNAEPVVFRWNPSPAASQAITGDWDGNRTDTVGLFDPSTRTFYLKAKNKKNRKATVVSLGSAEGDWVAIAGDWNGDDVDSIGLYDRATGRFQLRNANSAGAFDADFVFDQPGMIPVVGDWNQDGVDTIGVFDPATAQFRFRNENSAGEPDVVCQMDATPSTALVPIVGDWDYNTGVELIAGRKEAFCWLDTQRISGGRAMQFFDCNVKQGLTAGWSDIYIRGTDCQWIEIDALPPGNYQLSITVNAAQVISEEDYTNNSATVKVHIPAPKNAVKPPKVTVIAPEGGREFAPGERMKIRWSVQNGARVTRQELWLVDVHDDHPSKVQLIDGNIPASARSYTWTPGEEFATPSAHILVRAQDDDNCVGTDSRSTGTISIGDHDHEHRRF